MSSEFQSFIKNNLRLSFDGDYYHNRYLAFLNSKFGKEIKGYCNAFDIELNNDILNKFELFYKEKNIVLLELVIHKNKKRLFGFDASTLNRIYRDYNLDDAASVNYSLSFQDDLFLYVIYNFQSKIVDFQIIYHDSQSELATKIYTFFEQFKKEETIKQPIYTLLSDKDGLVFESLGKIHHSFVSENYPIEIVNSFTFLQTELSKPNLQNKFTLLSGPPGSGKTHFVRALISSLPNTAIINLDQSVASNFSSSQILSALLKFKQENDFQSILFLIEDADYLILNRSLDNMGALSSLLNASDGILGEIFNLRILATTNAKKIEIEKALLRPGRLLKHVEFGMLSIEQANKILTRLSEEKNLALNNFSFSQPQTLASVYQKIYNIELETQK